CFGAKYVGAAHSSGILCGRRERVEAAFLNSFTAYETERNRTLGRGYKVDRQEIVGTLFALREWMNTDHEERLRLQEERIQTVASGLAGLPHVTTERTWDTQAWMRLRVRLDEASGKRAADVVQVLREGE